MPSADLKAKRKSRRLARVIPGTEYDAICSLLKRSAVSCGTAGWEQDEVVREDGAFVVRVWDPSGAGGRTYMGCWQAGIVSGSDIKVLEQDAP